jgi:DNA repair exonuclease SbcCD ATPase subunit
VSKKDVEKQKKSWEGERQELQLKIGKLETIATERQSEINDLQSSAEEASRLAMELEQERSRKAPAPAPTLGVDTTELNRLQLKVAELQTELTQARNASTSSTTATQSTTTDLQVRRLQRELEKARRDISALEQSLEQSEEENQSLRTYVPLPGSPGRAKMDDGRTMQLESENENLRAELESLKQTMATLRIELESLQSANAGLAGLQPQLEALKAEAAQKEDSIRAMREESQVSYVSLLYLHPGTDHFPDFTGQVVDRVAKIIGGFYPNCLSWLTTQRREIPGRGSHAEDKRCYKMRRRYGDSARNRQQGDRRVSGSTRTT